MKTKFMNFINNVIKYQRLIVAILFFVSSIILLSSVVMAYVEMKHIDKISAEIRKDISASKADSELIAGTIRAIENPPVQ